MSAFFREGQNLLDFVGSNRIDQNQQKIVKKKVMARGTKIDIQYNTCYVSR